jgi:glycosyltransferase involved in cell wall biosynthesis
LETDPAMTPWTAITWSISNRFGWGVYGMNFALRTLQTGATFPICLGEIVTAGMNAEVLDTLKRAIDFREQHIHQIIRASQTAHMAEATVLHGLGNGMEWPMMSQAVTGGYNVGVIFFEHTDITPDGKARLAKLNGTVAGSTWNAEVLKGWGVENVATVFQGVDTDRFRPMPSTGEYDGKFVVFSGGKFDYRKGQDIVLAAFSRFSQRHDDAVLMVAWQNLWPLTGLRMSYAKHLDSLPFVRPDGFLNLTDWAAKHGVDPEKFIDLGLPVNEAMPGILRDADVAVFPNRCEGGTNLVAMETMACGVPCIIADNTGQKDLIDGDNCYVLTRQDPVSDIGVGTDGWGESDVDEIVEQLEAAYSNRDDAKARGRKGADFMRGWDWSSRIDHLLSEIETLCGMTGGQTNP